MPRFLNTSGKSTLGIGLCARCSRKFSLTDLFSDPNAPGLMVCKDDLDEYDPYRLAPRAEDFVSLAFVRPDYPLFATDNIFYVFDLTEGYIPFMVVDGSLYVEFEIVEA
jgi:hypothetical protein